MVPEIEVDDANKELALLLAPPQAHNTFDHQQVLKQFILTEVLPAPFKYLLEIVRESV